MLNLIFVNNYIVDAVTRDAIGVKLTNDSHFVQLLDPLIELKLKYPVDFRWKSARQVRGIIQSVLEKSTGHRWCVIPFESTIPVCYDSEF